MKNTILSIFLLFTLFIPSQSFANNLNNVVIIETSMGSIWVALDPDKAPKSVENFLYYVNKELYDNTIFHRVIKGFMVQGGGFNEFLEEKPIKGPVVNESHNGLKNNRGTIAMARTNDPDSASNQFFINLADNAFLNNTPQNPGYTVFGRVIRGMDVVDEIAEEKVTTRAMYDNIPKKDIFIKSIRKHKLE